MRYPVVWHDFALDELEAIVMAVKSAFGSRTARKVLAQFRELEGLLAENPYLGTEDKDNAPFRVLHSWHNRIYYIFDNEKISILAVWPNRQDDSRVPDLLFHRKDF